VPRPGDSTDFGGHYWIPEGTASNIGELELLWPMLFLYRRPLKAGADGAGRFRGGRGFVEAGIPWTVPGIAAAVYVDESFPKAVGPFGGNPGSAGHFRLKHGTDVVARLAWPTGSPTLSRPPFRRRRSRPTCRCECSPANWP
jgi:N-methylhydantoinase B